ncbi:MAG: hypothetical protein ACREER_09285 [Alphaproteobacteria bacterium]
MIVRVLALLVLLVLAVGARAAGFVSGTDDLPLMDGLAEIAGSGTVFDKPSGRFVEAYAAGPVSEDAVAGFYRESLPHLGWSPAGPLIFTREGERLSIVLTPTDAGLTVRFSLAPE